MIQRLRHNELIERLQNLIGYTPRLIDIAKILEYDYSRVRNRSIRESFYNIDEINKISNFYNVNLFNIPDKCVDTYSDKVEIHYYTNPNLKTKLTVPDVTTVWFDRQVIENRWKRKPENIRVITMLGDKMDHGAYPLRLDDILFMDISDTDVTKSGIYAFTTNNDSYMFINGINRRYDNMYRFYFYNPIYPEKILTGDDVKKADIKIVGRIFKNLSLTI